MAHIEAYKQRVTKETGNIIHLGCTSCFVQDNADMLIYIKSLQNILNKLKTLFEFFRAISLIEKETVCLGYTHYQPAQFTTLGKRLALWSQDIFMSIKRLERLIEEDLFLLGAKGATGTQDSYLKLFADPEKVLQIDEMLEQMFDVKIIQLSGQTYPRKMDNMILDMLSEISSTMSKIAFNIRLLQHDNELCEPHDTDQIGSSAMAYKHNPMRCERICSLERQVHANKTIDNDTHQILERSLDDSANRRLAMKQSLILTDYQITLMCNIIQGIQINRYTIKQYVDKDFKYIITEKIIMFMCSQGYDRSVVHEHIRVLTNKMRFQNAHEHNSSLITELKTDPFFNCLFENDKLIISGDPTEYIGISDIQVTRFFNKIPIYHDLVSFETYFEC
jgi:adenylosuccinate lyase